MDDIPYLPLRITVLAVTFVLSGFFSGSETALFAFRREELEEMRRRGGVDALIAALREDPKRLLITILFGNMFVNVLFYSVSFTMLLTVSAELGGWRKAAFSLCSLLVILLGGEVMPKNLAFSFYRPFARATAWPIMWARRLLTPIVVPLAKIADAAAAVVRGPGGMRVRAEDLHTLVRMGAREGVLDPGAGQMISEVIELADVGVAEVMVPRVEMISFDLGRPQAELLALFRASKLTMIPVYDGEIDNMRGLIHVKDVLLKAPERPLSDLVRSVPFLPASATVEGALRECRRQARKTAFVVDEYGVLVGLVTVEDLLEEIVGEIGDEYDVERPPDILRLEDGRWRVRGTASLRDWAAASGMAEPDGLDVDTVGGLVMALLDRVPEAGDTVTHHGMQFTVESLEGRRADMVMVARIADRRQGERDA